MANELEFLTINEAGTSWVDLSPSAESTGYQAQNTNIEARTNGQDDTTLTISGTTVVLDPSGVIDDNGVPITIKSQVVLSIPSDGTYYIKVVAGTASTQRSLQLVTTAGLWDISKNAYYEVGERILNWEIRQASSVVTYYKRMKPESGLIVPKDLIVSGKVDITGALTSSTIDTGAVNATSITSTGAISGTTIDTGNGATEIFDMDQDLKTTDDATFNNLTVATIDTGNGAVECFAMDQPTRTTDDIVFNNITANGEINPTTSPTESTTITIDNVTITTTIIPRGIWDIYGSITQTFIGNATLTIEKYILGTWVATGFQLTTTTTESRGGYLFNGITSTGLTTGSGALRLSITGTTSTGYAQLIKT